MSYNYSTCWLCFQVTVLAMFQAILMNLPDSTEAYIELIQVSTEATQDCISNKTDNMLRDLHYGTLTIGLLLWDSYYEFCRYSRYIYFRSTNMFLFSLTFNYISEKPLIKYFYHLSYIFNALC